MFLNKEILILLLFLPLIYLFFLFCYKKKKENISKFAEKDLLPIISNIDLKLYLVKSLLLVISLFFIIVALARPQYVQKQF